jgi:hypothetical protein
MTFLNRSLLVFAATLPMAVAQTTSSSLSGSVVDAQGAAVGGASIIVRNMDTNPVFNTKTGMSGDSAVPCPSAGSLRR